MKAIALAATLCPLLFSSSFAAIIVVIPQSDNTMPYSPTSVTKNNFDIETGEATTNTPIFPTVPLPPAADVSFGMSQDGFLWQFQSSRNLITFATNPGVPNSFLPSARRFEEGVAITVGTDFGMAGTTDVLVRNSLFGSSDFSTTTQGYVAFYLKQATDSDPASSAPRQYGWMEIAITDTEFSVLRWAYESVPGAPIIVGAVPEPSVPSVLGLGGLLLLGCRRRGKSH